MTKPANKSAPWHGLACPKCKLDDCLDVQMTAWTRLTRFGSDATQAMDGSEEWDKSSQIVCRSCGHQGAVADFDPSLNIHIRA